MIQMKVLQQVSREANITSQDTMIIIIEVLLIIRMSIEEEEIVLKKVIENIEREDQADHIQEVIQKITEEIIETEKIMKNIDIAIVKSTEEIAEVVIITIILIPDIEMKMRIVKIISQKLIRNKLKKMMIKIINIAISLSRKNNPTLILILVSQSTHVMKNIVREDKNQLAKVKIAEIKDKKANLRV